MKIDVFPTPNFSSWHWHKDGEDRGIVEGWERVWVDVGEELGNEEAGVESTIIIHALPCPDQKGEKE